MGVGQAPLEAADLVVDPAEVVGPGGPAQVVQGLASGVPVLLLELDLRQPQPAGRLVGPDPDHLPPVERGVVEPSLLAAYERGDETLPDAMLRRLEAVLKT